MKSNQFNRKPHQFLAPKSWASLKIWKERKKIALKPLSVGGTASDEGLSIFSVTSSQDY
jgi:hypothetical protein